MSVGQDIPSDDVLPLSAMQPTIMAPDLEQQRAADGIALQAQPNSQTDSVLTVEPATWEKSTEEPDTNLSRYPTGKSRLLIIIALAVQLFMVNLEIPVVTTSIVAITEDLGGFDQASWGISSYLLGYVAVIVIFAKFSDIFGRKLVFILSILLFIIFSAACSAAQTMPQLIIFRAFQGMGGGGSFSLSPVIVTDLVPKEEFTSFVSRLSIVSSVALLAGPIIGGAISTHTSWRWVFIMNVPISLVALVFTLVGMPRDLGFLRTPGSHPASLRKIFSKPVRKRVDIPGTVLLSFAVISLTACFENAGVEFAWNSAYVITLLILSVLFWAGLLLWERYVTMQNSIREPVLPWTFFTNRVMIGVLLDTFLLGGPIIQSYFQIPQRFQLVYGMSGLDAGIRLIPFALAVPVGTGMAALVAAKFKIPAVHITLGGSCLQILGFALLATLPTSSEVPRQIYGFEVIAGLGCGINYTTLLMVVPQIVGARDEAVGLGATNQIRMMGSSVIIAISTAVFNSFVTSRLSGILRSQNNETLTSIGANLGSLPAGLRSDVREVLAQGYNRQMVVLCACAAAQVPTAFLLWKKKQIKI